jgi:hypothetical protein
VCLGFPASLSQASICGLRNLAGGHPLSTTCPVTHVCVCGGGGATRDQQAVRTQYEGKPATKEACLVVLCIACHLIYF